MLTAIATNMLRPHLIGGDMSEATALAMLALLPPGSTKAAPASAQLTCPECEDLVDAICIASAVAPIVSAASPVPAAAP